MRLRQHNNSKFNSTNNLSIEYLDSESTEEAFDLDLSNQMSAASSSNVNNVFYRQPWFIPVAILALIIVSLQLLPGNVM